MSTNISVSTHDSEWFLYSFSSALKHWYQLHSLALYSFQQRVNTYKTLLQRPPPATLLSIIVWSKLDGVVLDTQYTSVVMPSMFCRFFPVISEIVLDIDIFQGVISCPFRSVLIETLCQIVGLCICHLLL